MSRAVEVQRPLPDGRDKSGKRYLLEIFTRSPHTPVCGRLDADPRLSEPRP